MAVKSEPAGNYAIARVNEADVIRHALRILEERLTNTDQIYLSSPDAVRDYLRLQLYDRGHEVFAVIFLNNRHRVIAFEELFRGTIDGASVHPREVVKEALRHNAAAVILAHNHPSGVTEPSRSDQAITQRLKDALALVDVRVLDHLIVGEGITSFAERGLL